MVLVFNNEVATYCWRLEQDRELLCYLPSSNYGGRSITLKYSRETTAMMLNSSAELCWGEISDLFAAAVCEQRYESLAIAMREAEERVAMERYKRTEGISRCTQTEHGLRWKMISKIPWLGDWPVAGSTLH
jgi:hypothetical protein